VADPPPRGRRARDSRSTARGRQCSHAFFPPSSAAYPSSASSRPPRRSCVWPAVFAAAVSRLRRDASHKRGRPAFERARRRGCVRPIRGSSQSRRESLANARDAADHRYRGRKGDGARRRDVGLRTVRKVRDTAGYRGVEEPVVPSRGLPSELTEARSERRRGRRSRGANPPVASPTSTSTPTPTSSGGCCLSPLHRPALFDASSTLLRTVSRINK